MAIKASVFVDIVDRLRRNRFSSRIGAVMQGQGVSYTVGKDRISRVREGIIIEARVRKRILVTVGTFRFSNVTVPSRFPRGHSILTTYIRTAYSTDGMADERRFPAFLEAIVVVAYRPGNSCGDLRSASTPSMRA